MAWAPGIAPSRGVLETLQVTRPSAHINKVERGPGVAPGLSGWKPDVLLLNTTRALVEPPGIAPGPSPCESDMLLLSPWPPWKLEAAAGLSPAYHGFADRSLDPRARCHRLLGLQGFAPCPCRLKVCCAAVTPQPRRKWCAQGESHSRLRTGRPARCFYAMHAKKVVASAGSAPASLP